MRILSFLFILALYSSSAFAKPIEIYVGGEKYDSITNYRTAQVSILKTTPLDSHEQDQLQEEAKKLGVEVDPEKIKTIEIKPSLTPQTRTKLDALRADGHVDQVVNKFKQNWESPRSDVIRAQDLEDRLRDAAEGRKEPVLLISDPKKVRIMGLAPKSVSAKTASETVSSN